MNESNPLSPEATVAPDAAHSLYRLSLERRRNDRTLWARRELFVSISRLVVMAVIFGTAWFAVQSRAFHLAWTLLPVALFLALITLHERFLRRRDRAERSCRYFEEGIRRIEGDWIGVGEDGSGFLDASHLYASDLDVLGPGSLYQFLNRTRTRVGEATLARWLLVPADVEEVVPRQQAVEELSTRHDLREDIASLGAEVRSELDVDRLEAWARGEQALGRFRLLRPILAILAVVNVATLGSWIVGSSSGLPFAASAISSFACFLVVRTAALSAIAGVERTSRDLDVVAEILDRLERESFTSDWLRDRREELRASGTRPGLQIRALQKWVQRVESRRNAFFAPFAAVMLWTTQIAFVVEAWRARWGDLVLRWVEIVAEFEAASSLATFAFEQHEEAGFPEILVEGPPRFEAEAVGHPLLAAGRRVRNDIALAVGASRAAEGSTPQGLVISGSNMSGKSTFLRSCGLAVVMAFAGAPVVARRMRVSALSVGASIQIQDSLREGSSKFYAEIRRLRHVLDLAKGDTPALCLLDEILHGTNSHDRRIGASAVVKALLDQQALVLVTTHDLALARLTESEEGEGGRLRNVHFVDTIEDGRIHFDFQLRPGIVDKSNALALMREVGLDV